ncbi:hypothetical protein [Janibacter cremeus]|uniref:Uncharacterized protein n=1 Tax=Janibacter cremeus TaxID=1285192 RepID=A0A852W043_9MICO|nr:hypothetical protein [Janibacter cremeus]NYF99051.1 hypothetical protein [Janibacter cremeus]
MLVVDQPRTAGVGTRLRVTTRLAGAAVDELWFEVPRHVEDMVTRRSDPFAVALVLPAMRLGVDLHLHGVVTDELLLRLNHEYQHLHRSAFPQYRAITVTSDDVAPPEAAGPGVAAGFSGGVDSYALLHDYFLDEDCPPSLRVTHWLFNNVGSHGAGKADALFTRRLSDVRHALEPTRLPVIDVDSNVDAAYQLGRRHGHTAFLQTHTARNAAVAHLLAPGLGLWLYASSSHYRHMHVRPSSTSSPSESIGLQLLSTSSLQLRSVGGEYTRVDKTRVMADVPDAVNHLDVCIREEFDAPSTNCSACFKCLRTIYALELLGLAPPFFAAGTFDYRTYAEAKEDYEVTLLTPEAAPLEREIRQLAGEVGHSFSLRSRARAVLARMQAKVRRMVSLPIRPLRRR